MSIPQFDMMDLDVHTYDPEKIYAVMRDEYPLYWDAQSELWAVSRYEDVLFVSKNTDIFCSGQGVIPKLPLDDWPDEAMINLDGHAHTKQRKLISTGFTPKRISGMEDQIREITIELLDKIEPNTKIEAISQLCRPLPMDVIGDMLGYERSENAKLLEWTDTYTHAGCGPDHITEEVMEAFAKFCEHHEEILAKRLENPGNDLISVWLNAELDGEKLSEEKLMFEHNLLLVGGSETTRNAISSGLWQFAKNPEQWTYFRENFEDPEVMANAIDEIVRWASPFVRMRRTLTRDYEWKGTQMKEGQEIIMLYPSANRDPRAFENPSKFDIQRDFDNPPVAFGHGKHFCIGASLAKLEMKVCFEELLKRYTSLKVHEDDPPKRHASCFIRGLKTLPLTFIA